MPRKRLVYRRGPTSALSASSAMEVAQEVETVTTEIPDKDHNTMWRTVFFILGVMVIFWCIHCITLLSKRNS